MTADLKPIYKATTEEAALPELDRYEEVWSAKYPFVVRLLFGKCTSRNLPPIGDGTAIMVDGAGILHAWSKELCSSFP
ncbi:hypothetical protein D3C71_1617010 [compost metagenome]